MSQTLQDIIVELTVLHEGFENQAGLNLFNVSQGAKEFCLSFCFVYIVCVKCFSVCCVAKVRSFKWMCLSSVLTVFPCFCWCLECADYALSHRATPSSNFSTIKDCVLQFSSHYY